MSENFRPCAVRSPVLNKISEFTKEIILILVFLNYFLFLISGSELLGFVCFVFLRRAEWQS
jgi:hypothetical protein